jgi:hypothetical protein
MGMRIQITSKNATSTYAHQFKSHGFHSVVWVQSKFHICGCLLLGMSKKIGDRETDRQVVVCACAWYTVLHRGNSRK